MHGQVNEKIKHDKKKKEWQKTGQMREGRQTERRTGGDIMGCRQLAGIVEERRTRGHEDRKMGRDRFGKGQQKKKKTKEKRQNQNVFPCETHWKTKLTGQRKACKGKTAWPLWSRTAWGTEPKQH